MKLSVCIDAVLGDMPLSQSIRMVHEAGIPAIEFWSWDNKDIDELQKLISTYQMEVSSFCTGFISLVDAAQHDAYESSLLDTIAVAKRLGCKNIITQTGSDLSIDRSIQRKHLVDGLKRCAHHMEDADITLLVEPLNLRVDHAGYFLSSSDEAADILKEVGSSHVKMLYDIYHQQITEGDLIRHIQEHISCIGHFHAAGNPGRHELYDSEIDYSYLFRAIKKTGYSGYVALEYFPKDSPEKGLEFAKRVISCSE